MEETKHFKESITILSFICRLRQPGGMRVFIAVCAHQNYLIEDGDAFNAYSQSPPQDEPTHVRIDEQYAD